MSFHFISPSTAQILNFNTSLAIPVLSFVGGSLYAQRWQSVFERVRRCSGLPQGA